MATSYSTGTTVQNIFLPNLSATDPAKTGMLFSQRILDDVNSLIPPVGSNPMPCLYKPIYLSPYSNGITALVALAKMGFVYSLGLDFVTEFIQPDSISVNNSTGLTTITWTSETMGIQYLVDTNPSGSITQGTSSGTIRNVRVGDGVSEIDVVPITGSTLFNTTSSIDVSAILDEQFPNPETSDPVCVLTWYYYQQAVTLPSYDESPDLYISVGVYGRDSSISPTGTAIPLIAPTTAIVLPDGSVDITYAITAEQLGLLPNEELGSTIVTQDTSLATGTFNGYELNTSTCTINIINVTGTFDTTNTIEIVLDITQNGFAFLGDTELSTYALGFNIPNYEYLVSNHADYVAGISALQEVEQTKYNKFKVQGSIGLAFTSRNEYSLASIIAPDTTGYLYGVVTTPSGAFDFPITGGCIAVANMYLNLNNDSPYYNTSGKGIIMNMAIPSDPTAVTSADQLTGQGLTVFLPNGSGLAYPYNNVNCLQTNAGLVDLEYRFQSAMQKVRWLDRNQVLISEATLLNTDGTRKNNSPETIKNVQSNLLSVLTIASKSPLYMFGTLNNSVVVVINPTDVTRLITNVTTSITPANNGNEIINYFNSYIS